MQELSQNMKVRVTVHHHTAQESFSSVAWHSGGPPYDHGTRSMEHNLGFGTTVHPGGLGYPLGSGPFPTGFTNSDLRRTYRRSKKDYRTGNSTTLQLKPLGTGLPQDPHVYEILSRLTVLI